MPLFLKFFLGAGVLWSLVYSTSYALLCFKEKKHKTALTVLVLLSAMLVSFILSCVLPFFL